MQFGANCIKAYQKKLSYEHLKVFAGLNKVSAGLNLMCGRNRFVPAETQPCL